MGHFLAVTAIHTESVSEVAQAISEFVQSHGVSHETMSGATPPQEATDALIFNPVNGWMVVLWPSYFNAHDFPLIKSIALSRGWLISGVHVYDGDYWEHLAFNKETELHSFCSRPGYWADEPAELERVAAFKPQPQAFCAALGVPVSLISPYLVDVDKLPDDDAKAQAEDQFELADFWVFTDFWQKLGIIYPDPPENPGAVVRLSKWFSKRLPRA
jgi:hypothetical protein